MKAVAVNVQEYFAPIHGLKPWRARLGHGSFLTFDFGSRIKRDHHYYGEWRLWIYQSTWTLQHGGLKLADSDSKRHVIELAVQRLEKAELTAVEFDAQTLATEFVFSDFRLLVSPADYLEDPDERDEYWLFFMPENVVLTVGPGGVNVGPSDQ